MIIAESYYIKLHNSKAHLQTTTHNPSDLSYTPYQFLSDYNFLSLIITKQISLSLSALKFKPALENRSVMKHLCRRHYRLIQVGHAPWVQEAVRSWFNEGA